MPFNAHIVAIIACYCFAFCTFFACGCGGGHPDAPKKNDVDIPAQEYKDLSQMITWDLYTFEEHIGAPDINFGKPNNSDNPDRCDYQKIGYSLMLYGRCGVVELLPEFRYEVKFEEANPVRIIMRDVNVRFEPGSLAEFGLEVREPDAIRYDNRAEAMAMSWQELGGFKKVIFYSAVDKKSVYEVEAVHQGNRKPRVYVQEERSCKEIISDLLNGSNVAMSMAPEDALLEDNVFSRN